MAALARLASYPNHRHQHSFLSITPWEVRDEEHWSHCQVPGRLRGGGPAHLLPFERINLELNQKGYNVKSDVWSLGITMARALGHLLLVGWSTGGAVPGL